MLAVCTADYGLLSNLNTVSDKCTCDNGAFLDGDFRIA